jgi:hypothetical protein
VLAEYNQMQFLCVKSTCATAVICSILNMRQLMLSIEYFKYCTQMKVAVRCALYRILKESLTDVGSSVNQVSEYRDRFIIFRTHRQWRLQKSVFWTMWTGQLFPFLQTDSRGVVNHKLLI